MVKVYFLSIAFGIALISWVAAQERGGLLNRRIPIKPGTMQPKDPSRFPPARPTNAPARSPAQPTPAQPAIVVPPAVAPSPMDVQKEAGSLKIASNPLADSSVGSRSLLAKESLPSAEASIVVATEAERNQKIAEGWSQPWACLFLTGHQHGYIEPCGCTGLENQKGGLNRRDTLLQSLVERGWDVIPIDAGDQVRRLGRQSEMKFARTAEAFKLMNYRAVMYGIEELGLSSTELYLTLTNKNGEFESPFVAANIGILEPDRPDRFKVIEAGGRRIVVTGVLGDDLRKELLPTLDITVNPAVESLKKIVPAIQASQSDLKVLIAHTTLEESRLIAQQVPIFDLVVTAGGFGEPLYKPESIPGTKTVMLQVGVKGMYAGIVGLYDDPNEPIKYQRVALSSQFKDSPRVMELFARYQKELEQSGLSGLGLRPLSHPSTREFVGSEKCGDCHTIAFDKWKQTPHSHATESIINPPGRADVPRHFDPECISCHVTGWNPQWFSPYVGGYLSLEKSPHLLGSGCENCHGPGSQHAAAESGDIEASDDMLVKLREEMRLPLAAAQDKCLECHDIDNSPSFHQEGAFQKFWEQVEHYGKD